MNPGTSTAAGRQSVVNVINVTLTAFSYQFLVCVDLEAQANCFLLCFFFQSHGDANDILPVAFIFPVKVVLWSLFLTFSVAASQ